ncbi:MAG TPA: hypothetical protein VG537_04175 [Candidatus Kapabacteria bacterium]|nr:hypothetical protein [Candidatus Kapabacteria bacterium]
MHLIETRKRGNNRFILARDNEVYSAFGIALAKSGDERCRENDVPKRTKAQDKNGRIYRLVPN